MVGGQRGRQDVGDATLTIGESQPRSSRVELAVEQEDGWGGKVEASELVVRAIDCSSAGDGDLEPAFVRRGVIQTIAALTLTDVPLLVKVAVAR